MDVKASIHGFAPPVIRNAPCSDRASRVPRDATRIGRLRYLALSPLPDSIHVRHRHPSHTAPPSPEYNNGGRGLPFFGAIRRARANFSCGRTVDFMQREGGYTTSPCPQRRTL
ncbi:hypothetical protein MRX96_052017 [Rhipicephalus microplus]